MVEEEEEEEQHRRRHDMLVLMCGSSQRFLGCNRYCKTLPHKNPTQALCQSPFIQHPTNHKPSVRPHTWEYGPRAAGASSVEITCLATALILTRCTRCTRTGWMEFVKQAACLCNAGARALIYQQYSLLSSMQQQPISSNAHKENGSNATTTVLLG